MGADDPSMGWSRYCESMRIAHLDPSLVFMPPTLPAQALAARMAALASQNRWEAAPGTAWRAGPEEATALSMELLAPAHDDTSRVGATVRVMHIDCWLSARVAAHKLARLARGSGILGSGGARPAALFPGRSMPVQEAARRQQSAIRWFHRGEPISGGWAARPSLPHRFVLEKKRLDTIMVEPLQQNQTKELVLRSKCHKVPLASSATVHGLGGAHLVGPRRLRLLVERGASWPTNCREHQQLCSIVERVAIDRAVMAAVSNGNILGMLGQFVEVVQRVSCFAC